MPTIATLVPAYNAARHIKQALDSVAAQTRRPDQVVVVDDGSVDDTAAVVEGWAAAHPDIPLKLIRQANGGASAARNAAIHAADTELIAFLDADDLYEPAHHERLAAALESQPRLAVVFGQQSVFTEQGEQVANFLDGKPIEQVAYAETDGVRMLGDGLWAALVQGNFLPTSGSMTRRALALQAGLFDTSLKTSEDRDLWLRISRLGGLGYLPVRVAQKREHDANLTGDHNAALVRRQALDVILKQLDHAAELGLSDEELAATRDALRTAADAFLYQSSCNGLGAYRQALATLADASVPGTHASWRGWLRALLASLGFGGKRR